MAQLVGLPLQDPGQHQIAARLDVPREQRREQLERRGEDVGQHQRIRARCDVRQADPHVGAVRGCIGRRRCDGRRVDVDGVDAVRSMQRGTDREDPRAAAVVEHALPACDPRRRVGGDPAQAHPGGGMRARAEGEPRFDADGNDAGGNNARIMGPVQKETPGPHRRQPFEAETDPVLIRQRCASHGVASYPR